MPKEYRKLVFSEAEIKLAITDFCGNNGMLLPRDKIAAVKFTDLRDHPVVIEYTTEAQSSTSEIALSRDQLAASLIAYCRHQRIPVPRSAEKNIKFTGSEIALLVHVPS